jgi:hypothetical protein
MAHKSSKTKFPNREKLMAEVAASYADELAREEAYELEEVKVHITQVKKLLDEVEMENQKFKSVTEKLIRARKT